ncbi:MAG TPA: aldehyde dehydrogenase family protein [Phycisphaerales bacterium]|nr:aldehyde dehydrogenase family protein [Phycisphaerales bacterium]
MNERLDVVKTYKLFINGQFPRSESGRSIRVMDGSGERVLAHVCRGSRKDLRDAVVAARAAHEGWMRRAAYNRGQILYRMSEMLEGKRREFVEALENAEEKTHHRGTEAQRGSRGEKKIVKKGTARAGDRGGTKVNADAEVSAAVDRLVSYAGWADKFAQVLGCNNPVVGPYYNFTIPEGTGVVGVVAPDSPGLLGLVSLIAPALCGGCTVVALGSELHPLATCIFGEVCATSDVPAGVVNLLTGERAELLEHFASHREIDAIHAANLSDEEARVLRLGAAENVKRVRVREVGADEWFDAETCQNPWWIEPFVEMKTIWHPSGA